MGISPQKLYAVIMAGGKGVRFWPAGRKNLPKQLLSLLSNKTMIEETVQRLFPLIAPDHILVITNRSYVERIQNLLPIPAENVIGEPEGRDTAPCTALATALVRRRDPDATMILLPADHMIHPAKLFQKALLSAAQYAQTGALVTLGIVPTSPSTGYGYLHLGAETGAKCYKVLEFKEKPDEKLAEVFFRSGSYRWNGGMFIWTCAAISKAFARYAPALSEKLEAWADGKDFLEDFAECEKISIDYAVMEKADNVFACDVDFSWNDIGSWNSLRSILPMDECGNVVRGNIVALDAKNNILVNDGDGLLGVLGISDCAVIRSGNGILVCPLSMEQQVKKLVQKIESSFPESV